MREPLDLDTTRAYTPPAIARLLRVHVGKIHQWIAKGELAASNVGDGATRPRWRIMPADLDAFLRRRQATPTPQPTRRRRRKPTYTRYFS